jgi:signal transduction histidine kinase/ActR/RegA family two-component response regulator
LAYHKLLERQIKRHLPDELECDPRMAHFLAAVEHAYQAFDRDKQLSEHAFRVSENDYLNIYAELKGEIEIRNQSIHKLKEALGNMETDADALILPDENNLLDVINYLNIQINKRKEAEAALHIAKSEAEKANQAKSDFLSVMSHEIRTPLNAVIGLGQLLLRQNPRPDQVNNMQVLKKAADNLLVLINDVLDFSKINASKLELDYAFFDIRKMVDDLFLTNGFKAQEAGNNFVLDIDPRIPNWLYGDSHRLTQVLNNLLSNAIKFTKKGSVTFSVNLLDVAGTRCLIRFAVKDTGIGIENDKLVHIFSPFTQSSGSITRQFGGTGLGLAITAELLKLMNSQIKVETTMGLGSTFSFDIDLLFAEKGVSEADPGIDVVQDLQEANILLVEDTPFNVLFTTQLLQGWNAHVEVAENGMYAVEKLKTGNYDLVLMDLHMPVMDGYTATRQIREFNQYTPIMALTASTTAEIRDKIFDAGMQDYVTKPVDSNQLFVQMQRVIKSSTMPE